MGNLTTIEDIANLRSIPAAVAANPGSIAIENIANSLKQVDDQGNATGIGGASFPANTGPIPIAGATGTAAVKGTDYLGPTWYDTVMAPIRAIDPTLLNVIPFDCASVTKDWQAQAAVGSGLVKPDQSIRGGGLIFSSGGAGGNGNMNLHVRDYNAANPPGYGINMKTDPWAVPIHFKQGTAIDANAECAWVCIYDGATDVMVGAIGAGSTSNVSLYADGNAGNRTDTGLALDTTGWHDGVLFFDKNGLKNGTPTLWWVQDGVFATTGMTNLANFGTGTVIDFRNHSFGVGSPARTFQVARFALVTAAIL